MTYLAPLHTGVQADLASSNDGRSSAVVSEPSTDVLTAASGTIVPGTSPIPPSSGKTVWHRLDRGGDRALNCAIHTIAVTRMLSCPRARLGRPVHLRRKERPGNPPLPQTVHRPRALLAAYPVDESCRGVLDKHRSLRCCDAAQYGHNK